MNFVQNENFKIRHENGYQFDIRMMTDNIVLTAMSYTVNCEP